jgi:hypothetical protein
VRATFGGHVPFATVGGQMAQPMAKPTFRPSSGAIST